MSKNEDVCLNLFLVLDSFRNLIKVIEPLPGKDVECFTAFAYILGLHKCLKPMHGSQMANKTKQTKNLPTCALRTRKFLVLWFGFPPKAYVNGTKRVGI